MEYKKLVIDNFMCFKHFEVDFAPDVSVIIGKNGAGKTSLIKAIVYSLYFMFTNDRSMGSDFLAAGNPDLKMKSPGFHEFFRNKSVDEINDVNLHGELELLGKWLKWDMYRRATPGSALYPAKYKEAYHQLMEAFRKHTTLPVIAYYSDSFPHRHTNISTFAKEEMRKGEQTLRNFGYYQWDNELACTGIWQQRLTNALLKDTMLNGDNEFNHKEVDFVVNGLRKFSRPIHKDCGLEYEIENVFVSFNADEERELWLRFTDGSEKTFDMLPAGYKRLYSVVLDLLYRAFLLNRTNLDNISGLVLIDEIDLHLHPSLAAEVVERFTRSFPDVQFVMTSHSPLVIAHLQHKNGDNRVMRLVCGEDKAHTLPDLYGIDYNVAVRDVLEVGSSEEEVSFVRDSLLRAMRLGKQNLVELRKKELRELVSEERFDTIVAEVEKICHTEA